MSSIYTSESVFDYPIPSDGITFGSINANGITTFIGIGNTIFSGSYSYDTVTITLKGINLPAPIAKPTTSNVGNVTFSFRNRTWRVLDTVEGYIFRIGSTPKLNTWSITGVDLNTPRIKV